MSIFVQSLDVEIRIWGDKVEDIVLAAVCPVFPAFIPALYEHLAEAMLSSEIDVSAYLLVVC